MCRKRDGEKALTVRASETFSREPGGKISRTAGRNTVSQRLFLVDQ